MLNIDLIQQGIFKCLNFQTINNNCNNMEESTLNYGANPNEAHGASGKLDLEDLKFLIKRKY
jgi:hypothetical protein